MRIKYADRFRKGWIQILLLQQRTSSNSHSCSFKAFYDKGYIVIQMKSGVEIKFPVNKNIRLAKGSPEELNNIEFSPYGLHWPDLDEDLSFKGLLRGDYGQYIGKRKSPCCGRDETH